jgi:hypothetical protein
MRDTTRQTLRSLRRSFRTLALAGWLTSGAAAVAQLNPGAPQPQPQPDIEQILQSAPKGKLTVRAVLVSGGSTTPVPGAHAEVHLFHDNRPFRQLKVLLDEHGAAVLEDLPIVMGVVPLVRVEYKGLTYQEAGPQMDASNRESSIDVKVYDTTEQMPAWRIPMRHVIATPSPSGVAVTELVVIDNPSDKTWLGKEPDEKGNRPTVELERSNPRIRVPRLVLHILRRTHPAHQDAHDARPGQFPLQLQGGGHAGEFALEHGLPGAGGPHDVHAPR